ncbi:YciI family protein [Ramlibacter sp.]|uniref:YciI family protein n=1 Tax=Ramlibacter sp. TaxID=1917967 RepID=UPI0017FC6D81|nr:YciI family protein [Ramlibacter sp.]MBA2672116.1 hypothetical protein [Ramlibacter sp.]
MQQFAFLYRPTQLLDEDALARRSVAIREWVLPLREQGVVLCVCVFDDAAAAVPPPDGHVLPDTGLAGVTIVQADDLHAAQALARQFPGREFGAHVEVRPLARFLLPGNS